MYTNNGERNVNLVAFLDAKKNMKKLFASRMYENMHKNVLAYHFLLKLLSAKKRIQSKR